MKRRSAKGTFKENASAKTRTDYWRYDSVAIRTKRDITSRRNFSWPRVILECFHIRVVLSTARNNRVVFFFPVHLVQAKDKIFKSEYNLTFLTSSRGKQNDYVGDVSKDYVVISFTAPISKHRLLLAVHKWLRTPFSESNKIGGKVGRLYLSQVLR